MENVMGKIIVVDDSMIMRRNLKQIFTNLDHDVVAEAANGVEALEAFKEFRPDLVTMDITMPVMDGVTSMVEILKVDPKAKVLMISSIGQKDQVIDALDKGACNYILKPINYDKVAMVVQEILVD
jgi:two-component system chemotaxis response regulator CheY